MTLEYICKVNEYVSRNESLQWGFLRTGTVGVGGFTPTLPVKGEGLNEIAIINAITDPVDCALDYFAYACKQQLFLDGDKRISTIVASKILIENGCGLLTLGKDNAEEFNRTLNNWYLENEERPFKECLKKCVRTLEI